MELRKTRNDTLENYQKLENRCGSYRKIAKITGKMQRLQLSQHF